MAASCRVLLLLFVWIRRLDLFIDTVGQGEFDYFTVVYHHSLTVSCKAIFLHRACHIVVEV